MTRLTTKALLLLVQLLIPSGAKLAMTPPMGWYVWILIGGTCLVLLYKLCLLCRMSWEIFRCEVDCHSSPNACINNKLYESTVDALVSKGYLDAGYDTVHMGALSFMQLLTIK